MKMLTTAILIVIVTSGVDGQQVKFKKHENVIYGMISGMALLMDIYQPEKSNHRGVIFIGGSGFGVYDSYQRIYNQKPLKGDYTGDQYAGKFAQQLVDKGYTVFFIDHRFAPRYHYPDIFYDCQRAVKFIRYNAEKYDIDPKYIGAMGHSSGAYLSSMLGVVDTTYQNISKNPIDSLSGKVQAVVSLAAPYNLADFNPRQDSSYNFIIKTLLNYIGEYPKLTKGNFELSGLYAEASPIIHVTENDAAFLKYHSTDDFIPYRQAVAMNKTLTETAVASKLVTRQGQGHGPIPDMNEIDLWFKKYLEIK